MSVYCSYVFHLFFCLFCFFFFKQKTAYEMRISDWSSDVCSSDLPHRRSRRRPPPSSRPPWYGRSGPISPPRLRRRRMSCCPRWLRSSRTANSGTRSRRSVPMTIPNRSEEHTSELQSLMRISYAVFCLKKKTNTDYQQDNTSTS